MKGRMVKVADTHAHRIDCQQQILGIAGYPFSLLLLLSGNFSRLWRGMYTNEQTHGLIPGLSGTHMSFRRTWN